MSLIRVPTHSTWSTLHHSSASRSAGRPRRRTRKPSARVKARGGPSPPCLTQTWFTSKGLGGIVIEINAYGMLLGALGQSSHVLHIVELCDLKKQTMASLIVFPEWVLPIHTPKLRADMESRRDTAGGKSVDSFRVILNTLPDSSCTSRGLWCGQAGLRRGRKLVLAVLFIILPSKHYTLSMVFMSVCITVNDLSNTRRRGNTPLTPSENPSSS